MNVRQLPGATIVFPPKPEILIIAYAHTRRLPGYWKSRVQEDK